MLRQALLAADGFHFLTFEEEWTLGRRDRLAGVGGMPQPAVVYWVYAVVGAARREGDIINVRTYRIGQHDVG